MTRVHKGRHDMWWFHTQINNCELHVSLPLFEGFGLDTSHVRSVPEKVCVYIYTQYIILWFFGVSFPPFLAPATSEKLAWKQKKLFLRSSSFFISIQLIDTAWRNMFSDGRIDDHEGLYWAQPYLRLTQVMVNHPAVRIWLEPLSDSASELGYPGSTN